MDFKKETIIRSIIIFLGFVFLFFSLYQIYNIVNLFFNGLTNLAVDNFSSILENLYNIFLEQKGLVLALLIIGVVLLYIGIEWKNIFKSLSKAVISIAVFFLVFAVFYQAINLNSEDIVNSIQPSIDYVIVYSLDDIVDSYLNGSDGSFKFLISKNRTVGLVYNKNLSKVQADLIISSLNIDVDDDKKIIVSKIVISSINKLLDSSSDQLSSYGISKNDPIPLNLLSELVNSYGFDLSYLNLLSKDDIESLGLYNNSDSLNLILSTNSKIIDFNLNKHSKSDVEIIWKGLGFNENISYETKEKVLKIILYSIKQEYGNKIPSNIPIPLDYISAKIPKDYKYITKYDLLDKNVSKRIIYLEQFRDDCYNKKINLTDICDKISLTKYDNFMLALSGKSSQNLSFLSTQIKSENFSIDDKYLTLNNLNNTIDLYSEKYISYYFYFFIFLILGTLFYYLHFKLFNREFTKIDIFYFISKEIFFNYLFGYVFLILLFYLIEKDILAQLIIDTINGFVGWNLKELILSLPVYISFKELFSSIFFISNIIFIAILVFYLVSYFLNRAYNKKKIEF